MTENAKKNGPVYTGIQLHPDKEGGYDVWVPSDWRKIDLIDGRRGWVFTPNKDNYDTCFIAEKITLEVKTTPEDKDILVEGFEAGIQQMPEVEIEETRYEAGKRAILLEAKFTFTDEGGQRRKRWVKSIYWGEGNLVLIAQGASLEEYEYWLPMLYNAMNTYELGVG
jgi:hypothetical protein